MGRRPMGEQKGGHSRGGRAEEEGVHGGRSAALKANMDLPEEVGNLGSSSIATNPHRVATRAGGDAWVQPV